MLVLTEAAAEVVKSVTASPQAPEGAGLRIASAVPEPRDPSALQLVATAAPNQEDEVIEADGARVFLEPSAAAYLADKVLDVQFDEQGAAQFALARQQTGQQ
jgi:iron-sulfur cluster assembly protein